MEKKESELIRALREDYEKLYIKEYTTGWREQRLIRNIELGIMSLENTERYISRELDKAREEGMREVLENELFIGDYDVLKQGLRIRTVDRENFLAQIYKTVKEKYSWAFGTATYKQALKMIENSLTSQLTPYVGLDAMVDEARIEELSKLKQ